MISLNTGDARYIIDMAKELGLLRNQLAYCLATAYHETWTTIKPIKETQKPTEKSISDATVKTRLTNAFKKGQLSWVKSDYWTSGFFGRGYIQLTHKENYAKATKELGFDFVKNPSAVMDKKYAAKILLIGMRDGWFTGKKLSDFIDLKRSLFFNARVIVNGDKNKKTKTGTIGEDIAKVAEQFDKLLLAEGYGVEDISDGQNKENVVESTPVFVPEETPDEVKEEIKEAAKEADKHVLKKARTWTWASVFGATPLLGFGGLHLGAQLALVGGVMAIAAYAIITIPAVRNGISKLFSNLFE